MSRKFPDFINACSAGISGSPIPDIFIRWSSLSAVAGALGRRCWFDRGAFKIGTNLFITLVGGPGTGKSVSLILPFEHVFESLTTPIGSKPGDDHFNVMLKQYGNLDKYPLYLIKDRITPEKLAQDMKRAGRIDLRMSHGQEQFHDSSVTLVTSEFGTLLTRNERYLQFFLTDAWDSKKVISYRTKTAGEFLIRGPCLNWIACATPEQLVENLPENARTQGLLSRMIPVYYTGERMPHDLFYAGSDPDLIRALQDDLSDIAHFTGEFKIEPDAIEKVREDIRSGLQPQPTDQNLSEYCERRESHLFKIAMALSASRRNDMLIGWKDWVRARDMLGEAESLMPTVLKHFGLSKSGKVTLELQIYVKEMLKNNEKAGISASKFRREILRRVNTASEVEHTLNAMLEAGMIKQDGKLIFPGSDNG